MVRILGRVAIAATLCIASAALADGDAEKGHAVFHTQCAICHRITPDGAKSIGPNLFGVVGRKSGTLDGYSYSSAMKASNLTWNDATLAQYLPAPMKLIPGIKMTYAGLKNPAQLADLIAYLNTAK